MDQLQEVGATGAAAGRPHATLTTYAEVREAFRHKDLEQALYDEGSVVMRDVLLTLHGDVHRTRRRAENVLFSLAAIRDHQLRLIPETLAETLAPFLDAGEADLVRAGHLVTINLVADLVGVDRSLRTHAESEELYGCALTLFKGAALVHATGDKARVRAKADSAMRRLDAGFLTPSIARRLTPGAATADLLSTLLQQRDRLPMSLEDVKREVAFYLEGGSHSTATALTDAVHNLFEWRREHPGERGRSDLRFLQRCAHETLRLHPASPVAWRRAAADLELPSGVKVPAGGLVVLDLMSANRDPTAYGEDAALFNPDRALAAGVSPWGTTFGGGIHACIGQIFAAGLPAGEGSAADLYGALPLMLRTLLEAGMRPDPGRPPTADRNLARPHWGTYWVLLDRVPARA